MQLSVRFIDDFQLWKEDSMIWEEEEECEYFLQDTKEFENECLRIA